MNYSTYYFQTNEFVSNHCKIDRLNEMFHNVIQFVSIKFVFKDKLQNF